MLAVQPKSNGNYLDARIVATVKRRRAIIGYEGRFGRMSQQKKIAIANGSFAPQKRILETLAI